MSYFADVVCFASGSSVNERVAVFLAAVEQLFFLLRHRADGHTGLLRGLFRFCLLLGDLLGKLLLRHAAREHQRAKIVALPDAKPPNHRGKRQQNPKSRPFFPVHGASSLQKIRFLQYTTLCGRCKWRLAHILRSGVFHFFRKNASFSKIVLEIRPNSRYDTLESK